MSRIGDALLRAREEGTLAKDGTRDLAPAWVRPIDPSTMENVWTFDPPAPAHAEPEETLDSYPAEPATAAAPAEPAEPVEPEPRLAAGDHHFLPKTVDPAVAERVVGAGPVPAQALEHYRRLAAVLHEAQKDRGVKVVMITSAVLGEGKSLTAANLALTLSGSYRRRVLLVDADLRRPSLHKLFQVDGSAGLSDGLLRANGRSFIPFALSDALALLPAGRPDPDPMASLTSPRMSQLMAEARGQFDFVIIDTPPVSLMPDAKLLAGMADTVLLVVASGVAGFDAVKQAVKAIGRKKVLGIVFNRAEQETDQRYYQD